MRRAFHFPSSTKIVVAAIAIALSPAAASFAAPVSWSATAPTIDGADIANFTGASNDAENISHPGFGAGSDEGAYCAGNRPARGQTFTTGSDPAGYTLQAVTYQHVFYRSDTTF